MEIFLNVKDQFISAVLSTPEDDPSLPKIKFQIFHTKNGSFIQKNFMVSNQAFHENYPLHEGFVMIEQEFKNHYRQLHIKLVDEEIQYIKNGKKIKKIIFKNKQNSLNIFHNRKKNCHYSEGEIIPFLVETDVMSSDGKVKAKMQSKFRQINKFLEIVEKTFVDIFKTKTSIHLVDIGCGKAYLTFALYDLLKKIGFEEIILLGIDQKVDVMKKNEEIAKKLGMTGLSFVAIDANCYQSAKKIDGVVALHACDNATDMAIRLALKWQAKAIFLAPCCHQYLLKQIDNDEFKPLLKYGILKERFSALLTDALRANYLENAGYTVDLIEFVDREDSLKNILIRAVLPSHPKKSLEERTSLKKMFKITPWLDIN